MNACGRFRAASLRVPALLALACIVCPAARGQPTYSANLLGYVDANFVAGSNLISNPLFAFDNTISNLLRNVPNGSSFIPWNRGAQQFGPANLRAASGWTAPQASLVAPDGGFLVLPSATRVTFVGQPWGSVAGQRCLTYPTGQSIFGWLPTTCCALDCDLMGSPPYTDFATVSRWNRQTQAYEDSTYLEGFGWIPVEPGLLPPHEAALFTLLDPFSARSPFVGTLQDNPIPTRVPSASMIQPRREGTNFSFSWASDTNASYAVFCSTNLPMGDWHLVARGSATPTSGVCTVVFGSAHPHAFYRLQPDWGADAWPVLLGGHRSGSSGFSFQFYAPAAASYTVERSTSTKNPTWLVVTNLFAGPGHIVAVSDGSATGLSAYYRVRY